MVQIREILLGDQQQIKSRTLGQVKTMVMSGNLLFYKAIVIINKRASLESFVIH